MKYNFDLPFLSKNGIFTTIIPYKEEINFVALAKKFHLHLNKVCRVKGNLKSKIKRSLLEFSFKKSKVDISELTIEIERHQYTKDYKKLVKDFYINM